MACASDWSLSGAERGVARQSASSAVAEEESTKSSACDMRTVAW